MSAEAARTQIKTDFSDAGLITTDTKITGYGYRKHNLTANAHAHGLEVTRALAGHKPGSNAIMASYWQGDSSIDIASALLGEDRMDRNVFDTLAMKR